jgi:hypothetical protein
VERDNRAIEIERLRKRLAEATARKAALLLEAQELFARLHDIRAAFGNPFSYSRPEHADESAANDTGYSSHKVALPTVLALMRVEDVIRQTNEQLRGFGVDQDLN